MLGMLRVTQALLPALSQRAGHVVVIGSTAGRIVYEGGGGYTAAKHARPPGRDPAPGAERPPGPRHRDRARAW